MYKPPVEYAPNKLPSDGRNKSGGTLVPLRLFTAGCACRSMIRNDKNILAEVGSYAQHLSKEAEMLLSAGIKATTIDRSCWEGFASSSIPLI